MKEFKSYLKSKCCEYFRERWDYYNSNKTEINLFEEERGEIENEE